MLEFISWPFLAGGFVAGLILLAVAIHIEYTFGETLGIVRRFNVTANRRRT
jgi:hypothetical protein